MGIVFHHDVGWRVRGAFDSEQAKWATQFLNDNVATSRLLPGTTYLVEIVYQRNRIVVEYLFEGLVLLGAYDERGDELMRPELELVAREAGMKIAAVHTFDSVPAPASGVFFLHRR